MAYDFEMACYFSVLLFYIDEALAPISLGDCSYHKLEAYDKSMILSNIPASIK